MSVTPTSASGTTSGAALQGVPVAATTPTDGQVLTYKSANTDWEPAAAASGGATYTANQYGVLTSDATNATMSPIAPDASTTKFLKSGGTGAAPSWASLTMLSKSVLTVSTPNSTYVTASGATLLKVTVIGGGGGGGGTAASGAGATGAGGGGGGGGSAIAWITSPAATYPYRVGNPGPGGAAGNNAGQTGSSSLFGTSVLTNALVANGGVGAAGCGTAQVLAFNGGGAGGTATGGDLNIPGEPGGYGMMSGSSATYFATGYGGNSILGFGGGSLAGASAGAGNAGGLYGGGGSGGGNSAAGTATQQAGSAGAAGVIVVEAYGP